MTRQPWRPDDPLDESGEHAFAATIASDSAVTSVQSPSQATIDLGRREVLAGRWEILGLIGSGGMGTVYRALDRELDEQVALKVLRKDVVAESDLERFRREVKLARKVTHKNVARVFELAEHDGRRFFTMELVEGESLGERLARTGPFSCEALIGIGVAVCQGLGAAHEVDVIHRDLKPDNVLIGKDGRIAITDFGIAASLDAAGRGDTQAFVGTPHYMAPEQVDGSGALDARTDIYALGAMLFELAVGRPPFDGPSPVAVAAARLTRPAPDPRQLRSDLPDGIARILQTCLARSPADRFYSATEVAGALAAESGRTAPVSMMPPSLAPSGAAPARNVRLAVLPLAAVGLGDDAYLADGVAEDLVDALSQMPGMRVVSYGSAVAERETHDPRGVGRALGVEIIVQGSLRRLPGDKLRLTVRLIGVEDGLQLWAHRYDTTAGALLDVNEEAAQAIAQAASINAPQPDRKLDDPVAIGLYLRARARYRDFWLEGVTESVKHYEQALVRVPDSPLLIAGHALALARLAFFSAGRLEDAEEAARRALAMAPDLGEAHLATAAVTLQRGKMVEAYRAATQAVSRSPSLAEAHQVCGRVLGETGPIEAALSSLRTAYDLDSASNITRRELVRVLALSGKWEEAQAIQTKHLSTDPAERAAALVVRLRLALWRGDRDDIYRARDELLELRSINSIGAPSFSLFAAAISQAIDKDGIIEVESFLPAIASEPGSVRRVLFFHQVAVETNAQFGSRGQALAVLRRAVDMGFTDYVWFQHCPAVAALRGDPEFEAMAARVEERTREVRYLVGAAR